MKDIIFRSSLFLFVLLIPNLVLPTNLEPYTLTKWHIWSAFLAVFSLFIPSWRQLSFPTFKREFYLTLSLLLMLLSYVVSIVLNRGYFTTVSIDAVGILILFLFSLRLFRADEPRSEKTINTVSIAAVTGAVIASVYCFLQYHGIRLLEGHRIPEQGHASFIGHHNQYSEYLVLALIFGYLLINKWKGKKKYFVEISMGIIFASLFLQNSRSLLLTFFLGLAALAIKERKSFFSFSKLRIGTFFLCAAFFVTNFSTLRENIENFGKITVQNPSTKKKMMKATTKEESAVSGTLLDKDVWEAKGTEPRLIMIINSFHLFVDHYFFGIGPENYMFGIVPYIDAYTRDQEIHESQVTRSPHNGFVEGAVESGIFFLIGSILFFIICFRRTLFSPRNPENLAIVTMTFFMVLLNFPMEGAWGSLFIPILMGKVIANDFNLVDWKFPENLIFKPGLIVISCLLCLLFIFQTYRRAYSGYTLTRDIHDIERAKTACRLNPDFWKHCVHVAETAISRKQFDVSEEYAHRELLHRPYNFVAIRALGLTKMYQNERLAGCRLLAVYERIMTVRFSKKENVKKRSAVGYKSSITDIFNRYCPRR